MRFKFVWFLILLVVLSSFVSSLVVDDAFCQSIVQDPNSRFMRANYMSGGFNSATYDDFTRFRVTTYGSVPGEKFESSNSVAASSNIDSDTFMGVNIRVNKYMLPALKCVERELVNGGVCDRCITDSRYPNECSLGKSYPFTPSSISSHRTAVSFAGSEISNHRFGIAVDFDAGSNPCCGSGCKREWQELPLCQDSSKPTPYEKMSIPICWVDVFKKYGFYWLGGDSTINDLMHFEFLGNPVNENGFINGGSSSPANPNCNQPSLVKSPSDSSRVNTYSSKWMEALSSKSVVGKTWFGKLNSNGGSDNEGLSEQGRLTIIFAPCTNDYSSPVELMYYFHGIYAFGYQRVSSSSPLYPTFDDFNTRIAPQLKELIDDRRNFIFVFPELPWSGGDQGEYNSKRKSGKRPSSWRSYLWNSNSGDSDLVQFQNDIINKVRTDLNINPNIDFVSMTGQSAGGRPLHAAASKGLLDDIQVKKITFSDADYTLSTKKVYDNYVKDNPGVELNMLVQDPSRTGAHDPTKHSIALVKEIGGSATSSWSGGDESTSVRSAYSTPGAEINKVFSVPGHSNVNYVPLGLSHGNIGAMSLVWRAEDHGGTSVSPSRGSNSQTSSNPTTSSSNSHMSCGSDVRCEELHKVWGTIGPMIGKNNFWKPSGKFEGGWVTNFDQLGFQTPAVQPSSTPSPTPSQTQTQINCQLTSTNVDSQSIGPTNAGGSLSNAITLNSNQNLISRSIGRDSHYGTLELVHLLEDSACKMNEKYDVKLVVADLSNRNGGECSGHLSHQSGRDADVGVYYYEGGIKNKFLDMCLRSGTGTSCHTDPIDKWTNRESLKVNFEFVQYLNQNNQIDMIFLDQKLIDSLSEYATSIGSSISNFRLRNSPGHQNHYHIRIKCPQGDVQCTG